MDHAKRRASRRVSGAARRPTAHLCRFAIWDLGFGRPCCDGMVRWRLRSVTSGLSYHTCDAHLAAVIREHSPDGPVELEPFDPPGAEALEVGSTHPPERTTVVPAEPTAPVESEQAQAPGRYCHIPPPGAEEHVQLRGAGIDGWPHYLDAARPNPGDPGPEPAATPGHRSQLERGNPDAGQ